MLLNTPMLQPSSSSELDEPHNNHISTAKSTTHYHRPLQSATTEMPSPRTFPQNLIPSLPPCPYHNHRQYDPKSSRHHHTLTTIIKHNTFTATPTTTQHNTFTSTTSNTIPSLSLLTKTTLTSNPTIP
ncbi:hypothetical protein RND81_07G047400 [Saponaria officinalis]|uniref:Uncharacterized protein n=1 Tax=Saponaria officinalis TaxID=3572 RepID=A0AAW1JLY2_SAPOF